MPTPVSRTSEPLVAVVDALRRRGPLTRAEIAAQTGLSRTTVSGLVSELQRRGMAGDVDSAGPHTGGRPAVSVALLPAAGIAVGVDVGRTHVRVVASSLGHQVLAERAISIGADNHAEEVLDAAAELVDGVLAECGHTREDVLGVALGVPAPLDANGVMVSSSILPGWAGLEPAKELHRRIGVAVHTENDANLGALAEALWGTGRGNRIVFHVKAASGIGAGLVVDGRLFRGATGTAGELGHTTVHDNGGVCRCGNRGCLELSAGATALLTQTASSGLQVRTLGELIELAQAGEAGCRRVLADAGDQLGLALANVVNLINPDVIVFGGELSAAGELVLAPLRARVARSALAPAADAAQVRPAALGDRAEALGAALLVIRELERFDDSRLHARCRGEAR